MSDTAAFAPNPPVSAAESPSRKRKAMDEPAGAPSGATFNSDRPAAAAPSAAVGTGANELGTIDGADPDGPGPAKRGKSRGASRGTASSRATGRGTGRGRARGAGARGRGRGRGGKARGRRDDDEDEDDELSDELTDAEDDDDDGASSRDEASVSTAPTRTASGRRTRPTTKAVDMQRSSGSGSSRRASPTSAPTPLSWSDDFESKMAPANAKDLVGTSLVPREQVEQDLAFPTLARVGELVWVRVPLGPPPAGALANAQLSRWPGIIRARTVVVAAGTTQDTYRVELLGMSSKDTLEGVRGENVLAWVSYIPSNTAYLDETSLDDEDSITVDDTEKRWQTIQSEGWLGVANAFRKAHRIGKAYAAIQIRPVPHLCVGSHLAAPASGPSDVLGAFERRDAHSRYLSYSHVLCGPELVHVGDYIRLVPSARKMIGPKRVVEPRDALPTSLVLKISSLYRGEGRSPLMARGLLVELVPARAEDRGYDRSLYALPTEVRTRLPPPLPLHKWRLFKKPAADASSNRANAMREAEVDIIFDSAVAGRLYPISPEWPVSREPDQLNLYLKEAVQARRAAAGMGEEGIRALAMMLGGMSAGERTVCFRTTTFLAGDRTSQLTAAQEQALASRTSSRAKKASNRDGRAATASEQS